MSVQIIEERYNWAKPLVPRSGTKYIVLHHAEASICTAQDIHQWHLNNGWAGIGYHYFVRKDGSIYRGRPRDALGAHCQGWNDWSVGICAEGDYMTETMPQAQENAIIELCHELLSIYSSAQIVGHRDLNATSCPGDNYPLAEIQQAAVVGQLVQEVLSMFQDVPTNHWAAQDIEWLAQKGLIHGDDTGAFRPDAPITRAEVVALIARVLRFLGVK